MEAAVRACGEHRNHRYTPTAGLPELREAVAAKTLRDSGLDVSPQQVIITAGGKHAVYNALLTLLDPGDEVILPAPYWPSYPEPVALAGARSVVVHTGVDSGYRVTVEQLEAARTPRTKLLIFVSPSNPTGSVYPPEEVAAIGNWAAEHGIWVMTDEIYEHLTYDDHRHVSLPVVAPAAAERCVVINGVAKTYAMTGWRVGWIIAPPPVAAAAAALQTHQTSNVANVSQRAALAAVSGSLDAVAEMRAHFDRRRRTMHEDADADPRCELPPAPGRFLRLPLASPACWNALSAGGWWDQASNSPICCSPRRRLPSWQVKRSLRPDACGCRSHYPMTTSPRASGASWTTCRIDLEPGRLYLGLPARLTL